MNNPYLTPARVRAVLSSLSLRPTRGMGQNFLVDPDALTTIVAAGNLQPGEQVVEVGPGMGVLTWELLQRGAAVVAVELDKRLHARLHAEQQHTLHGSGTLRLVQGDILDIAPRTLVCPDAAPAGCPPYKVIANLPYAITSPVLRHFLTAPVPPVMLVVLVQWEVAQRIAAQPGDMSVLAHSIQVYAEPEVVARVPANSFLPAPAVDSAIMRLWVRPSPVVAHPEAMLRVVKAGFLHARKKLANGLVGGLAAMGMPAERAQVQAVLAAADVDATRRAETLSTAEWDAVAQELWRVSGGSGLPQAE